MYEIEYFGSGLYSIDEGNGLTLMLPKYSRKSAQTVAEALQCAYDKGRRDEAAERDTVEEDDSWQDQEGFYTAMDILS